MLQITADIFSGRPNPTLEVEANEAMKMLEEIAQNRSAIAAIDEGYQGLGYRGLVVETLADNIASKYDLPATFRIAHNSNEKGLEIAERVLSSMLGTRLLDEAVHRGIIEELQRLRSREEPAEADAFAPP